MLINTWQFNLVLYILLAVAFNQFYKLAAKDLHHDGAGTIIMQTLASLFALLLIPFFPMTFPSDWRIYVWLLIACVFYAINDRLQTTVRKHLEVSVFTIINKLSSVFLIIIGLVFFHETLSIIAVLGAILLLSSTLLLSYQQGKFTFDKYLLLGILSRLISAIALSIDVDIARHFNLAVYIVLTLLLPTLMIKISERISIKDIVEEFKAGNKKYFILTGLCWALFIVFMLRTFQLSTISMIAPLSNVSILLNVLLATIFLGEKQDTAKKILAAILTILGAYLMVVG